MASASHVAHTGLPFANPMAVAAVDATVAAHPGAAGLGVDHDPDAIEEARRLGGAGAAARFEVRDAGAVVGPFDAALCVGASHALGGFPVAIDALRRLAPVVLYGEGYWRRSPSPAFLEALGGASADELTDLPGLRRAVAARGLTIQHESLASVADWARYEETLAANALRHGGPGCAEYARRILDRRALPGGCDTLGFALFVLVSAR